MTIYSNKIDVSVTAAGGPGSGAGPLQIVNYTLKYVCTSSGGGYIHATGYVYYNGSPVSGAKVYGSFCSMMQDGHVVNPIFEATTPADGSFVWDVYTQTPPGGQNCIGIEAKYGNYDVVATKTITIPSCGTTPVG